MTAYFGLGAVLASEMIASNRGAELQEGGLQDPARRIAGVVAAALAKRFALEIKGTSATVTSETTPKAIAAASPGADLVLHITTSRWGFAPAGIDTYGADYDGALVLIDARNGAVIAAGT